jgi:hypothetical protein
MVVIGLVLVGLAIAAGADVAAQNHVQALHIHAAGQTFTTTPGGMVAVGAVCALACALGIMLLREGAVRQHRLRLDARAARVEPAHVEPARPRAEAPAAVSGAGRADMLDNDRNVPAASARGGWLHRAAGK